MPRVTDKRRRQFPRVPYALIDTFVNGLHVATPDAEITAEWTARATESGATPAEVKEIVRYALACHRENRNLYARVMSGRL